MKAENYNFTRKCKSELHNYFCYIIVIKLGARYTKDEWSCK